MPSLSNKRLPLEKIRRAPRWRQLRYGGDSIHDLPIAYIVMRTFLQEAVALGITGVAHLANLT